jgi:hypothetical protein
MRRLSATECSGTERPISGSVGTWSEQRLMADMTRRPTRAQKTNKCWCEEGAARIMLIPLCDMQHASQEE